MTQWLFPVGVLTTLIVFWRMRVKWGPGPLAGVLYFIVTLFPALGFFDVYPMRYSLVADHFQYLASIGVIAIVIGSIIWMTEQWGKVQTGITTEKWNQKWGMVGIIVLLLLGMLSWRQGYVYNNLETLWRDTLAKNPGVWMAHNNLGSIFNDQGKIEEAIAHFSEVQRLKPDSVVSHNNLGVAYSKLGRIEIAIKEFKTAIQIDPQSVDAYFLLGTLYSSLERYDEAITSYKKAVSLKPDHSEAHFKLGWIFHQKGKLLFAIKELQKAIESKPDFTGAHFNLGVIYDEMGLLDKAIKEYTKVIELEPGHYKAYNNLGIIYGRKNKYEKARAFFKKSLR